MNLMWIVASDSWLNVIHYLGQITSTSLLYSRSHFTYIPTWESPDLMLMLVKAVDIEQAKSLAHSF